MISQQWTDCPRFFLAKYIHKTETEQPLIFDHATAWQVAIIKDDSTTLIVQKCSQVGVTVMAILRMLNWLREGWPGVYVLPSKVMMEQFVKNRIDPILADVSYYKQNYGQRREDATGAALKTIFRRRVKFAGSNVRNHFFEFPAGWAIVDEHDECDTINIRYLDTRLGRSEVKRKMIIGNPTFADRGIDDLFKASDQKEWHITCPRCETSQSLTWFENCVRQVGPKKYVLRDRVVQAAINKAAKKERLDIAIEMVRDRYEKRKQDARIYCKNPKCQKPIDRHAIGEWKVKHPDRPVSGYHINKIFADPFPPAFGHSMCRWPCSSL
jgi:phage terminase large subunit GpA-like protein